MTAVVFILLSYIDIRKREIPLPIMIISIAAIIFDGIYFKGYRFIFLDIIAAAVFIISSVISRGNFGMADALILAALSISFGSFNSIFAYMSAVLIVKLLSIFKIRRKKDVAFIPYIFAGFMLYEMQTIRNIYL